MPNQLLYMNIKIPVELTSDGQINSLNEYMNVEFTECAALPETKGPVDISEMLLAYMANKYSVNEKVVNEQTILVLKNEIKNATRPINSSFKKRQYRFRQTAKNMA